MISIKNQRAETRIERKGNPRPAQISRRRSGARDNTSASVGLASRHRRVLPGVSNRLAGDGHYPKWTVLTCFLAGLMCSLTVDYGTVQIQEEKKITAFAKLEQFLLERRGARQPVEDLQEFERELHSLFATAEAELVGHEVERFDIDLPFVTVDGIVHQRVLRCEDTYFCASGPVQVMRSLYSTRKESERAIRCLGAQLAISVHNCPVRADTRFPMSIFKRTQRKYVKKAYRVRNWREYEAGLRNRGSLTVWISLTAGKLVNWDAPRPRRKFFDRVNHQRLLDRLSLQVKDRRVVTLIKRLLKAKVVLPDGMRVSTEEGTPQGGPLSPLLSNVVLDELDWELERRGLCFVRYADDCNIYVGSERACQRVMDSVRRFLEGRLRLLVNEDKSAVARPEERHFLGFRLRRNPDGQVEVHLSQRTVERLKLRIGELTPRSWGQSLKTCFEGLNEYLRGWFAYFRICTQTGADLFRVFDAHIRRRIRAIIIHQKRRNRFLLRALLARGVSRRAATGTAWSRRGTWHRSNRPGMTRAYPNPWFRARLFSLSDAWLRLHAVQLVSGQLSLFDHEELIPKSRM